MLPKSGAIDWIFFATRWWLESFGGFAEFDASNGVLAPTEADFPVDVSLEGHALAQDYFAFVQKHARLPEWKFQLVLGQAPNVADALAGMSHPLTSTPTGGPEASVLEEGEGLSIPYHISQLQDPVDLVATMARGVSHYLLSSAPTEFPGDPDEREYFVDLGAVLLGFGIFLANSAFRFQQSQNGMMVGWEFSRRGALSELDVTYVLALAAVLQDVPKREAMRHLTGNPKSFFKTAHKHITKKCAADFEALRSTRAKSTAGPYR